MKQRGMLTSELKDSAEFSLGRPFTQDELRLYPYLSYCFLNKGKIDYDKLNRDERLILYELVEQGYIIATEGDKIYPTRAFYDFMNDMLAESYVTFAEEIEADEYPDPYAVLESHNLV